MSLSQGLSTWVGLLKNEAQTRWAMVWCFVCFVSFCPPFEWVRELQSHKVIKTNATWHFQLPHARVPYFVKNEVRWTRWLLSTHTGFTLQVYVQTLYRLWTLVQFTGLLQLQVEYRQYRCKVGMMSSSCTVTYEITSVQCTWWNVNWRGIARHLCCMHVYSRTTLYVCAHKTRYVCDTATV